jgi:hypothetical protein
VNGGFKCLEGGTLDKCSAEDRAKIEQYRDYFIGNLTELVNAKKNRAAFSPACAIHGLTQGSPFNSPNWVVPDKSQNTVNDIIFKFLNDELDETNYFQVDTVRWPDNTGCNNLTGLTKNPEALYPLEDFLIEK